eukprot:9994073-Alexandrium_andersonii.AAC.1
MVARALFLSKTAVPATSALEYRVLTIASHVYRRWASIRLRCLDIWFGQFADRALFGGVPGKGAADAAFHHAVHLEAAKTKAQQMSTLVVDVHKCFDQVSRQVVEAIALRQ